MNLPSSPGPPAAWAGNSPARSAGTPTFRRSGPSPAGGPAAPAGVPVRLPGAPVPLDLTDPQSLDALRDLLAREKPPSPGWCAPPAWAKWAGSTRSPGGQLGMIDLNCRAAVGVTQLCLPYLTRGSRVLELCSTAAFQPMPGLGVYAATKAFLQSYTKTLHYELLPRGIHVTAVCPYWVKDTEFIPLAQDGKPGQFRHFPLGLPEPVGGLPLPGRQRPEPVGGHAGDCLHPAPAGGEGDSPCAAGAADGWAAAGVRG